MRIIPFLGVVLTVLTGCSRIGFDAPDESVSPGGGDAANGDPGFAGDLAAGDTNRGDTLFTPTSSPAQIGGVEVGWTVRGSAIAGGVLWIATTAPGEELRAYDLANPANPVLLGTTPTAGGGWGITIEAPVLYFVGAGAELEIFDISDPFLPVRLGGAPTGDTGRATEIVGDRAYVVSEGGGDDMEVFDISDLAAPFKLGGVELQTGYQVGGVGVVGTIAFAAGQQLWAIDCTDPTLPVVLSSAGFYWYAQDVEIVGTYAYGLEWNNSGADQLRVFDISDPNNVIQVGSTRTTQSYARDIAVVGKYAFVVIDDFIDDIEVFDISDPTNPIQLGTAPLASGGYTVAIDVDRAYVGGEQVSGAQEVTVFDLTP